MDQTIRGDEIASTVTAIRNRGGFVFVIFDTCDAAAIQSGSRMRTLSQWRHYLDEKELPPLSYLLSTKAGGLGAFYAAGANQCTTEASFEKDGSPTVYGRFTFALASLLATGELLTYRQLAEWIEDQYETAEGIHGVASVEITHPDSKVFDGTATDTALPRAAITLLSPPLSRGLTRVETATITVEGTVVDPPTLLAVLVHGRKAALGPDGQFKVELPFDTGENKIQVFALRKDSSFDQEVFSITYTPSASDASKPGILSAFVIGINEYKASIATLKNAVGDAEAVATLLRERFGAKTHLYIPHKKEEISLVLRNATRNEIVSVLDYMRQSLQPEDRLIIYYAGHGWKDKDEEHGPAHWWPRDAELESYGTYVSSDDITHQIRRMKARHVLLIADSCYSGGVFREAPPDSLTSKTRQQYFTNIMVRKARILISSGANEPVLDGGGGEHSVFARALLKNLRHQGPGAFTAHEVFGHIREAVGGHSRQAPQYMVIHQSGHDGGDFIFQPVTATAQP